MILLLLPLLDAVMLVPIARVLGPWLLVWLAAAALIGLLMLRQARDSMQRQWAGRQGWARMQALLDNQRTVLSGLLLIWPGLFSDVAACLLLATAPPASTENSFEYPLVVSGRR